MITFFYCVKGKRSKGNALTEVQQSKKGSEHACHWVFALVSKVHNSKTPKLTVEFFDRFIKCSLPSLSLKMAPCCCSRTLVSKPAPTFNEMAVMPNGEIRRIQLEDYRGKYVLLYFYPLDFTFVCPSEILAFDKMTAQLKELNVELIGCSVDSPFTHLAWKNTPREKGGIGAISHPLIADITKNIARCYNVLLENEGIALRGLFLIDKEGVLRHQIVNDLPLGRSTTEALRMVQALQHNEQYGEVCPGNWTKGAPAMQPTAEGVASYLTKHA